MTKFLLLHTGGPGSPRLAAELAARGELLDGHTLADPELAVAVPAPPAPGGAGTGVRGYWLVDVESMARAVQIAELAGGAVEIRQLMVDRPGPDL